MAKNPYPLPLTKRAWDEGYAAAEADLWPQIDRLSTLLNERDEENGVLRMEMDAAEADAARLAEALQRVVALRFSRDLHANSSAMASADAALDAHRERTEGHG